MCPCVEAEKLDTNVPHTLTLACKEQLKPNTTFVYDEFEEEEEVYGSYSKFRVR